MINIRSFKKCIERLRVGQGGGKPVFSKLFSGRDWKKNINNFAQYMEKDNNGYICLNAFVEVDRMKYEPEYAKAQK